MKLPWLEKIVAESGKRSLGEVDDVVRKMSTDYRTVISKTIAEWIELLQVLSKEGYFGEDTDFLFHKKELGFKEYNVIRSACLNFSRDRHGIIRYLSREDVRVIAECGCPNIDRKVVNSGKRLRKSMDMDEENVCGSCNLRGNCERAFVKPREDEDGRTVDVMRVLLSYALDPTIDVVENKSCLNMKVQESIRLLLKQLTKFGSKSLGTFDDPGPGIPSSASSSHQGNDVNVKMKEGDWLCPKCDLMNFARNIKCLSCEALNEEKLREIREDQEHLPLKKGDWICDKCNLINFARNTTCFVCKAKPPKRHLSPGEWECESCNYLNFRRNAACLKCDHKRPKVLLNYLNTVSHPPVNAVEREPPKCDTGRNGERGSVPRWKFTTDVEGVQEKPDASNVTSGAFDFPIEGGSSVLSHDPGRMEAWKSEMRMARKMGTERRSGTENKQPRSSGIIENLLRTNSDKDEDDDDDDEMSGWFAKGRT
ncbi:hypothetical protein MLD38_023088 [Melastoma candidum]|uniref:Uncharacterized protein n=1 Tax=Melastoma candidum TaxID=119954 RepID=A0ACB9QPV4_9MYRT|nr:hypothetical protein MLD38_023088 [Melastoma candidum]